MKRLLIFLVCPLFMLVSCNDSGIDAAFTSAETNMNENPEISLKILDSVNVSGLSTRRQKARYALLYSMALDKNYIDVKSDSIIAPALKYYKHHGSDEEKFRCCYYEARIYENAGDNELSLLCASKAESVDTSKVSSEYKYLLYALKGTVYHGAWRIHDAIESYELACRYALQDMKYRHYVYYCLMMADLYRYNDDPDAAYGYVLNAEKFKSYFTAEEIHIYYSLKLLYMIESGVEPARCLQFMEDYIAKYPQYDRINWHVVSKVYLYVGYPDKAHEMLLRYADFHDITRKAHYYGVLADVMEQQHDYKSALDAHRIFTDLVNENDKAIHQSDIKVIEERYESELIQSHLQYLISYMVVIAILLIAIIIYIYVKWSRERRQHKIDIEELKHEHAALTLLKDRLEDSYRYLNSQIKGHFDTEQEIKQVLCQRIKSLSAFLQAPVPDSLSKVTTQIHDLKKNKNYIVDNVGLLYAVTYPDFISELRAHDLTSSEIGYCCLYLLGLNIPEAAEVIGKVSSIYNVNSCIRKKLCISGGNLDKWLVKRFKELYPEGSGESHNLHC